VQEQNGRESVEPVDAARVSSWLSSTEAATMGQDAARVSPSDAASSMQQPQTLRERELEAEVQMLKTKLEASAKFAAQPPDLSFENKGGGHTEGNAGGETEVFPATSANLAQRTQEQSMRQIVEQNAALKKALEKANDKLKANLTATDDRKQALDDALKDVEDMKKKLDSSLPLSSTSGSPADSASAAALSRAEAAEGQLVDLQGHFNALLQVLSRRCGNNRD
jgi:hypothetical protein